MIRRYFVISFGAAAVVALGVGCASTKMLAPERIEVLDASTKRPVTGATVTLSGSGSAMSGKTDERGVAQVGGYDYIGPKLEALEITKEGYQPISLHLTNEPPHVVEIIPNGASN
jgi:hypothetical protein